MNQNFSILSFEKHCLMLYEHTTGILCCKYYVGQEITMLTPLKPSYPFTVSIPSPPCPPLKSKNDLFFTMYHQTFALLKTFINFYIEYYSVVWIDHILLICSPMYMYLEYLHCLAAVNNDLWTSMCKFLSGHVFFLGYIPMGGIAGSYGYRLLPLHTFPF